MSRPRFPELPRTRTQPRLEMIDVHHAYDLGGQTLVVLDGLGLEIWAGECVALCGPDGSGKNATLNLLSGLETPRSGQVRLDGQDMVSLKPGELHQLHHRIFCHVVPAFILDREAPGAEAHFSRPERLRLALARIMMRRPQVVLGELPERDAESTLMLDALKSLSKQQGTTVVLATKRPDLAAQADRCIDLRRSASRLRA